MKRTIPKGISGPENTGSGMDRRRFVKTAALASVVAGTGLAARQAANAAQLEANGSATGSVDVRGYRLRLVSIDTGFGIAANVYSYKENRWINVPRWVPTVAAGQEAAEDDAQQYLRRTANLELPPVRWTHGT